MGWLVVMGKGGKKRRCSQPLVVEKGIGGRGWDGLWGERIGVEGVKREGKGAADGGRALCRGFLGVLASLLPCGE